MADEKKLIYLDHAATTPLADRVLDAMLPLLTSEYGNASSLHSLGQRANLALRQARESIAAAIGANAKDIFFTGGGTEADNWAIRCAVAQGKKRSTHRVTEKSAPAPGDSAQESVHVITSAFEHHAVLRTCRELEKTGVEVTYLTPDLDGFIHPEDVEAAIREDTVLISIMAANNEVGTIQPVAEIGRIAKEHGVLFHTDAVQALGHIPVRVDEWNVDLLSASAHKLGGPKGIGFLYMRRGAVLPALLTGGEQESGRRAGTENVAGAVGFAAALDRGDGSFNPLSTSVLRDHLIDRVLAEIPGATLNGSRENRLPNNANFCFDGIDAKSLILALSKEGICASAASACDSGDLNPSHVLLAMGVPYARAAGSLRLTLGPETTKEDIDYTVEVLKQLVDRGLKEPSPLSTARALVAMSGGVDSTVAVLRMQEQGYDCVGATMKLYVGDGQGVAAKSCCGTEEAEIAARVAAEMNVPHYVFDYQNEFDEHVIEPFVRAYQQGITPNPCIECNRALKFDLLFEKADELGCEKVVTGHYARITQDPETGRWQLRRAADDTKDQSYVLYMLTQEQLARIAFPLGDLKKSEVRALAREHGFSNAEKSESQDICFVRDGKYGDFIRSRTGKDVPAGNIVDEEGNILGAHDGIVGFTIGQRKGLGIPNAEPWYVTEIRPDTNEVVVGRKEAATGRELIADHFNWLSIAEPKAPFRAQVKARYRQTAAPAEVTPLAGGLVRVVFDEPQWAITKGQAVVLYDGDLVLGGGTIVE